MSSVLLAGSPSFSTLLCALGSPLFLHGFSPWGISSQSEGGKKARWAYGFFSSGTPVWPVPLSNLAALGEAASTNCEKPEIDSAEPAHTFANGLLIKLFYKYAHYTFHLFPLVPLLEPTLLSFLAVLTLMMLSHTRRRLLVSP